MKLHTSVVLITAFLLLSGCSTTTEREPEREDREHALLRNLSGPLAIEAAPLDASVPFVVLTLRHVRLEIPRDQFPGDVSVFESAQASRPTLNEYFSSHVSISEFKELVGIDTGKLESLLRAGGVRIFDLANQRYLTTYVVADFRVYYGPLDATGGVVFLFPDSKRVIVEILHWIS